MADRDCHHGQLARVCDLCEKDAEIAALEARVRELEGERDRLRDVLEAVDALICAINENIGMRDAPLKYTVPWDKATALYRAAEKFKKSAALKG